MRKLLLVIFTLMCLLYTSDVCLAVDLFYADPVKIESDGTIYGTRTKCEILNDTSDTVSVVTVAKSGYTFVCDTTDSMNFTLPAAAAGLTYTFVLANACEISIDPIDTSDTIKYQFSGGQPLAGGDRLVGSALTGTCVTLVGGVDSWYVVNINGTWSDGN